MTFNIYSQELNSNNKESPSFKSFKTVMDEYKDFTMTNNLEECDKVEIRLNKNINFPNATIHSKTYYSEKTEAIATNHYNKLNFIHRIDNIRNPEIYFKAYGVYIENIINNKAQCRIIDYKEIAQPIEFTIINDNINLQCGDIVDAIGKIREGIQDGEYINEYRVIKVRKSNQFSKDDINIAIQNYNNYLEEIQELPF